MTFFRHAGAPASALAIFLQGRDGLGGGLPKCGKVLGMNFFRRAGAPALALANVLQGREGRGGGVVKMRKVLGMNCSEQWLANVWQSREGLGGIAKMWKAMRHDIFQTCRRSRVSSPEFFTGQGGARGGIAKMWKSMRRFVGARCR